MEKLSASVQTKMSEMPVQTILRDDEKRVDDSFTSITVLRDPRKMGPIPEEFDGRVAWKGLLTPPMDQGRCGSCWAFSSTAMLSDRFNIQSMGMMNVVLSPTKLILCNFQGKELEINHPEENIIEISNINKSSISNSACYGNNLVDACRYLYQIGVPTEECVPYTKRLGMQSEFQKIGTFTNVDQLPLCTTVSGILGDMCSDFYNDNKVGIEGGTPSRFFKAYHYYSIPGVPADNGSELDIRNNIYKWGPVSSGMQLYPDFYTFDTKNIYEWDGKGPKIGGHAIEIVGWGEQDKKKYWIVKNSWGVEWGDKGYFRILRGVNMCEIEANCIGMVPDYFYPNNYKDKNHNILKETLNIKKERTKITRPENTAGGIDPTTGYTRRVMISMPWLIFTPPVEWKNLPNWDTFVAGKDATIEGRARFLNKFTIIRGDYYIKKSHRFSLWFWIFTIIIGVIILILFSRLSF